MYAVVETGGKQYQAVPGGYVDVEMLPAAVGEQVTLDRVLLIADGADVRLGQPVVDGASVQCTVLAQGRQRKVTIFHYRSKHRERRKRGHRQPFTRLRIDQIQA
jgi:large subunit ribosomal protein L21